jgi:hypothetical protein
MGSGLLGVMVTAALQYNAALHLDTQIMLGIALVMMDLQESLVIVQECCMVAVNVRKIPFLSMELELLVKLALQYGVM